MKNVHAVLERSLNTVMEIFKLNFLNALSALALAFS